jgi:hypothetical protein
MAFLFKTERTNREGYFMYLAQVSSSGAISSTSLCSRLYVSSNGEQIGISESNTAPESTGAWLTVTPEVTQLGVVEFDFTTKKSNLYVFSEFPAAQPSSGYVTSAAAATVTNVGAVALRQYDARQRIIVDGIRIATTWNEAVKEVPFPPAFVERPAADTVLVTATTADIKMKLSARAKLYYTVKTAPVADITANDIIADAAKDSVTVGATEQTLSLSRLTAATKYYVYFTAQNAYGFSEIDSAIFTTPTIMVANPGFERWTGASPAAWTVTDSYAKDTETVKNGKSSIKITATSGRVDMKQAIHGVVAGKTYTISFWYYIETLNTTTGIRIYSNFYNGATPIVSDEILHPTAYQKATGEWRQFVIRGYTAPDSANSFNFEVRIMSGVTACFDDFYFAEGDKPAPSISVTPDSLSFSAMLGGSISQSVQVTTVDISENLVVSIGGSSISCFIVPATLKSGVDTLTVTYIPDEVGSHSATLTVAGGGASCKIPLAGAVNELPPSIAITPVGSICTGADTSPYNGQKVTVAGIVTAITKDKNFFVQSGSGAQSGIYVYRRGNLVRVGDSVLVTGWVSESHKLTEIAVTNDADITVASSMHALPAPTPVTVSRMSKVYHGVLLSLDSVEVAAHATDADKYVIGSGDTTLVVAQNIATTQPAAGAVVNIIGVGFCDDDVHQLLPRSVDDVKIVKDASPATAVPKPDERSVAIYPNPADDLLHIKSAYDVAKVEVYMLSGIAVLREEAVSFVNMATLKSGIYIVRVAFVNGSSIAKIIVKR